MFRTLVLACVILGTGIGLGAGAGPAVKKDAGKIQYARDIQPILSNNCFICHGPNDKDRKAGLRLDLAETATRTLKSGSRAVVPGDPKASELIARIYSTESDRMPPAKSHKPLKAADKELLKRWIAEGAEYQRHWAFVPPKRPELPAVKNQAWPRNAIDRFILARLEAEGLQPAPESDRYTLARRVAIDLTGLPPPLAMVDRFINDKNADAYEKYVDQVLNLPAYGERWAQVWLDLARYADSNGYANDVLRTIWKYRDWVIEAINANMTFDRFTIEQLAGDMLPKATESQILATAFHRNTLTNDEGGTSDEEFRVAAVVDRVNTTMQVWMGITMGCAQCHDHKYDPFTQEEYFRMFAILNQTEDADRNDNAPLLATSTTEERKKMAKVESELAGLEKILLKPSAELDEAQKKWEKEVKRDKLPATVQRTLAQDPTTRRPEQKDELLRYFRSTLPELKKTGERVTGLRKELADIKPVATPIMKELPEGKKRATKIHIRGNFLDQGKEVKGGVPALFHPLPEGKAPDRMALAHWLLDAKNPLTARVTGNRYWEQIFGVGLVETPDDYGIRGKLPKHPALLDWLAIELVSPSPQPGETGAKAWDVKRLLKLLVTSATYRQSSKVTPAILERDPDNRLFARGPRFRSSAETIRDQTLYVSGLLSPKMYGPPVRPPQPKLGLTAAFGGLTDWTESQGDDKYRRAMYTQWRRTTPYPSMVTFDAPSRNVCAVNRPRTNTPLQALVTLNDPVYVEAAQALARRLVKEGGTAVESKATHGFRLCLTRPPSAVEVRRLVELYEKVRKEFANHPKDAQQMATDSLGPVPAGMDTVELAAWTVVGNVLLNLDEMFAKR